MMSFDKQGKKPELFLAGKIENQAIWGERLRVFRWNVSEHFDKNFEQVR